MKHIIDPKALRQGVVALAVCLSLGQAAAAPFDAPDADFRGSISVAQPNPVYAGSEVALAGRGLVAGQKVTLERGNTVLGQSPYTVGEDGTFKATIAIPADAAVGQQPVVAKIQGPDAALVVPVKVSPVVAQVGADRFTSEARKIVPGLYQSAYSAKSGALFVTAAVGRPPVKASQLVKIDAKTLQTLASVTPAQADDKGGVYAVYGVAVDDAHGTVWVTNTRQGTVAVYRQSDLSLVKQFAAGVVGHPRDVVVDSQHNRAYVSAPGSSALTVFDTAKLEPAGSIAIASKQRGKDFSTMSLAFDATHGKLYTVSLSTGEAAVIDTATGAVDQVMPLPLSSATGVAVDGSHGVLFVASPAADGVVIADLATGKVLHRVATGAGALGVTFDPVSGLAYVVNRGAGTVTALNINGQIIANLDAGTYPNHVSVDGRGDAFVINKTRGENDPTGDRVTRLTFKK